MDTQEHEVHRFSRGNHAIVERARQAEASRHLHFNIGHTWETDSAASGALGSYHGCTRSCSRAAHQLTHRRGMRREVASMRPPPGSVALRRKRGPLGHTPGIHRGEEADSGDREGQVLLADAGADAAAERSVDNNGARDTSHLVCGSSGTFVCGSSGAFVAHPIPRYT